MSKQQNQEGLAEPECIKDKTRFELDDEQFERFEQALEDGKNNPALKALLATPKPWS